MTHHGLFGPPSRGPSRGTMALFGAGLLMIAIWVAIYFDLPSGVIITMIFFVAALMGLTFALDAAQRFERALFGDDADEGAGQ